MEENFLIFSAFIYGLVFGSFYNVVAYRLPQMRISGVKRKKYKPGNFLAFPWSFCPNCKKPIKFYHNIPVISYLLLRGRGACCVAPSIAGPIPGMPCVQLTADGKCRLWGKPERPAVCDSFRPQRELCGTSRAHAVRNLTRLERQTAP